LIFQAIKSSVIRQLREASALLSSSDENYEALALIIDGKSLTYALEDGVSDLFLELAIGCASVICCRSSPKQKALVSSFFQKNSSYVLFIFIYKSSGCTSLSSSYCVIVRLEFDVLLEINLLKFMMINKAKIFLPQSYIIFKSKS